MIGTENNSASSNSFASAENQISQLDQLTQINNSINTGRVASVKIVKGVDTLGNNDDSDNVVIYQANIINSDLTSQQVYYKEDFSGLHGIPVQFIADNKELGYVVKGFQKRFKNLQSYYPSYVGGGNILGNIKYNDFLNIYETRDSNNKLITRKYVDDSNGKELRLLPAEELFFRNYLSYDLTLPKLNFQNDVFVLDAVSKSAVRRYKKYVNTDGYNRYIDNSNVVVDQVSNSANEIVVNSNDYVYSADFDVKQDLLIPKNTSFLIQINVTSGYVDVEYASGKTYRLTEDNPIESIPFSHPEMGTHLLKEDIKIKVNALSVYDWKAIGFYAFVQPDVMLFADVSNANKNLSNEITSFSLPQEFEATSTVNVEVAQGSLQLKEDTGFYGTDPDFVGVSNNANNPIIKLKTSENGLFLDEFVEHVTLKVNTEINQDSVYSICDFAGELMFIGQKPNSQNPFNNPINP